VAWNIWAMARGEETDVAYLPPILGWEWQRRPGGTIRPVAAILFTGVAILIISAIDYETLLQFYLILRLVNLILEYSSLVWLRFKEPDTPRPFKVPFGYFGPIMLMLPTVGVAIFSMVMAERTALIYGASTVGVVVLLAVMLFVVWPFVTRNFFPMWFLPDKR